MGKATKNLALIGFLLIWFIFCYKFFIKGLVPAPLDFLTNFYNPWQAYQTFPIKNPAIPDVVSQIIPWKIYTIERLKSGNIPLWNPYNFSGTPHLANFQSAVFSPFNIIFFLFSFPTAWGLFILFQPLLAGLFTFFYARKIGLVKFASLISALSFAFCGFLTVWLEWGSLGWAILWLPATLLLWECFWDSKKWFYWVILNLVVAFSLLSGHLQISLYLLLTNFLYLLYARWSGKIKAAVLFKSFLGLVLPFGLTAFQLLPTLNYYLGSQRGQSLPVDWFKGLRIPFSQLITFVIPDFFGHPATRNQWGSGSYVEMMAYIGVIPFFLAVYYMSTKLHKGIKKKDIGLFFIGVVFISLILSLETPVADVFLSLKIPVFSSSAPSRIICLTAFSLSILAGYGWQSLNKALSEKSNNFLLLLSAVVAVFITALVPAYFISKVAFKNMIFPLAIFTGFYLVSLFFLKINKTKNTLTIYCILVVLLISVDLFRFWNKFLPFGETRDMYTTLPLINYFNQNAGSFRVFGILDDNLNLPFHIYSTSGYDSLSIIDYQQLVRASQDGNPQLPARVTNEAIAKNGLYTKKLLDMLGVKYVVVGKGDLFAVQTWRYPESYIKVWEDNNYEIYENKNVWPRFLLTGDYVTVQKDDILPKVLDDNQRQVFLESPPSFPPGEIQENVNVVVYEPEELILETTADQKSLLFVSDVYYRDWWAKIDNQDVLLLKANYAFRAVEVPAGQHRVKIYYDPGDFNTGLRISLACLLLVFFVPVFDKLITKSKQ